MQLIVLNNHQSISSTDGSQKTPLQKFMHIIYEHALMHYLYVKLIERRRMDGKRSSNIFFYKFNLI